MQNKKKEARKIDFFRPHGGRQKCVYVMWAYTKHSHFNTVLIWGSSRYEHCIVHPKFHLKPTCCLLSQGGCFV